MKHNLTIDVNGRNYSIEVRSRTLLVDVLRDQLHLTGTHIGCVEGKCGACTVLIDGIAQKSCLVLAVQVEGSKVVTVEGLESLDGKLDLVQATFWENHAAQCGYCTSGMLITAKWFLSENADPTRDQIRMGITGNLCRCTGYVKIVEAIEQAVATRRKAK